jgi:hypothetical protein avisC_06143
MALRKKTSPRPDTNQAPDSEEPTSTGEGSGAQDEDPAQGSEGGGKGSQGKGKDGKEPATEDPQDEVSSKKASKASEPTSSEKESGSGKESKDSKKEKGSASGSSRLVRFGKRAKEEDRKRLARLKRSGNPAKVAAALEEESRAAANRVSRTPRKIKDVGSPRWYAPAMVTLLITGLLWVVVTYLFKGQYPIPYFVAHHQTDWLVNGNLYVGFVIMMAGFLGLLNWK